MEVFGLMQQIYNRAQHSLGPDVGCYAPPKLWENELNESLQVQPPTVYLKIGQSVNMSAKSIGPKAKNNTGRFSLMP